MLPRVLILIGLVLFGYAAALHRFPSRDAVGLPSVASPKLSALASVPAIPIHPAAEALPNEPALIALQAGNFDARKKYTRDAQATYERGEGRNTVVDRALSAFGTSEPANEPRLNHWVEARGESFVPYAALGTYYLNLGWAPRGEDSRSRTCAGQRPHG